MSGLRDPRRRHLLVAALPLAPAPGARAQTPPRPDRSLRLTVAYPPGGVSDATARELARRLELRIGSPVIVDHRPGAGGAVAMAALARSSADGRVLCFSAITPLLAPDGAETPRYELERDIAPVAAVMHTPVLVVGTPAFAGKSFDELIAAARRAPGRLRWASSGQATTGHRVLEQVCAAAGVDIAHIPYAGGGQQLNDALAGHFEVLSSNVAAQQLAYVKEGRLGALAVGAPQRLSVLPEVPTLAELGYPTANLWSLFGTFAPGRTPAARLDELNRDINAVLAQPDFRERLLASGNLPAEGTRQDFLRRIRAEAASLGGAREGRR